jgi:hypothetical protein
MIPAPRPTAAERGEFFTDASKWGYGGVFRDQYFFGAWEVAEAEADICPRELAALVMAVELFGPQMRGKHVLARCDNDASVWAITKGAASSPLLNHLLRRLHRAQALFSVTVTAVHVPGVINVLADALSRNRLDLFFAALSNPAAAVQVVVPLGMRRWLPAGWQRTSATV